MAEKIALRDAFGKTIVELGNENPRIVALDADLGNSTRVNMFEAAHPERFFQVGIAEQNMMGIAAGLASMGFIPFACTFACFATKRATDQIRVVIAQPRLHVVIAGAYSGLLIGKTGKTHQSVQDIAIMRSMPDMTVLAPGDGVEAAKAVRAAAEHDGPVYLRLTRDLSPVIFGDDYDFRIGKAVTLRRGRDVTIMSTGLMGPRALDAAAALAEEGIDAFVLHVPTLKPLDEEAVVNAAQATGLVVTAEEHNIIGGLGSAVAEVLGEQLPTQMKRIGIRDSFGESAPGNALLEKYGLTAMHIAVACRELVTRRKEVTT
jgi:transketolase